MTKKASTRILRIGLEEVLGNHQPPDLSSRIMQELQDAPRTNDERTQAAIDDAKEPSRTPPVVASKPDWRNDGRVPDEIAVSLRDSKASNSFKESPSHRWTTLAMGLGLVIAAVFSVMVLIAIRQTLAPPQTAGAGNQREEADTPDFEVGPLHQPEIGVDRLASGPRNRTDRGSAPSVGNSQPSGGNSYVGNSNPRDTAWASPWASHTTPSDAAIATRLQAEFDERWTLVGARAVDEISDAEWGGRLFEAMFGRAPDVYEQERLFAADQLPLERSAFVDQLLADQRYETEFTRHWADRFAAHLLVGIDRRSEQLVSPEAFVSFLQTQWSNGVTLDQVVFDLLTAEGSVTPQQADFNPATIFLAAHDDQGKGIRATEATVELFLGLNARCAQCHDHQDRLGMSQADFWSINAHFQQMKMDGNLEQGIRILDADFSGEMQTAKRAAIFYEDASKNLVAAFPMFTLGTRFPHSGIVSEFDRRQALADAITHDERFPATMVNWAWTEVFGYPLHEAPTLRTEENQLSSQTLSNLARDFAGADFDLKRLVKWIVLSPAFSRPRVDANRFAGDTPWLGQPARFTHWYPRQPRFGSLDEGLSEMDRAVRQGPQAILALRSGLPLRNENPKINPSQAQADVDPRASIDWQTLRHGWYGSESQAQTLEHIVVSPMTEQEKIEHLFLLASGRLPDKKQMRLVKKWLDAEPAQPLGVYQDLWWALKHSR